MRHMSLNESPRTQLIACCLREPHAESRLPAFRKNFLRPKACQQANIRRRNIAPFSFRASARQANVTSPPLCAPVLINNAIALLRLTAASTTLSILALALRWCKGASLASTRPANVTSLPPRASTLYFNAGPAMEQGREQTMELY